MRLRWNEMKAYRHWEDGKQWLRIIDNDGNEWDEPIEGWCEVWNLCTGVLTYKNSNGLEIEGK
jgi:hypothetical protein